MECHHPLFGECSSSIITYILGTISLLSPGNTLTTAIVTNMNPEVNFSSQKPKTQPASLMRGHCKAKSTKPTFTAVKSCGSHKVLLTLKQGWVQFQHCVIENRAIHSTEG
jgi:hypothetical protein